MSSALSFNFDIYAVSVQDWPVAFRGVTDGVHHGTFPALQWEKPGRIPDLVGLSLQEAQSMTRSDELALSIVNAPAGSNAAPDSVTAQSPAPGSRLRKGERISVRVDLPATSGS
ncbi:MAG: PASTA domain-containing protein [Candidatus Dormibacteria bacterium]